MKPLILVALLALTACGQKPPASWSNTVPDNAANHPNADDECPRRDGQPCK